MNFPSLSILASSVRPTALDNHISRSLCGPSTLVRGHKSNLIVDKLICRGNRVRDNLEAARIDAGEVLEEVRVAERALAVEEVDVPDHLGGWDRVLGVIRGRAGELDGFVEFVVVAGLRGADGDGWKVGRVWSAKDSCVAPRKT